MKKKIIVSILIIIIVFTTIALPVETQAQTIREFESEVERYTKELEDKKSKIAKNDAEVAEIKRKIASIENQITEAEKEITALEEEIDKSNKELQEKTEESKKIIEYYQISNGDNAYLEYAFGASSITDMIYRMSIVEQLTEYNDKIMKELEALIEKNEQQKIELNKKKENLKNLKNELQSEKERIDADTANLKAGMPGLEEQIRSAKAQISSLKSMGCGQDESVSACVFRVQQSSGGNASLPSTNGFFRPISYGYMTQGYYDNAGALVIKIRHNVGGSYIYSTYAHLRAWYVNINQYVTENTVIGLMGSTGNSTGPHLHLEITTCDWKSIGGGCTWAQYQRSTINPTRYVMLPSRWNNR